jgi:hypothetical protein
MRLVTFGSALVVVAGFTAAPVLAGQHGHAGGPPAAHAPTTHGPTAHAPTTHGPTSHGPTTHGPATHGPSTHTAGAPAASGTSTTTVDFTSGPVGQRLSRNTALTSKLETRLTALGYQGTVYQAAYGFKNLGQFVAATHVSQNLGIPFDQLKLQMTGLSVAPDGTILQANLAPDGSVTLVNPADATTPAPTRSLGQSIHTLNSTVDSTATAQSATTQADAEIVN